MEFCSGLTAPKVEGNIGVPAASASNTSGVAEGRGWTESASGIPITDQKCGGRTSTGLLSTLAGLYPIHRIHRWLLN
jgi:hypothetical protein